MVAYILVEAVIEQPAAFAAYARAVPPLVANFGGEYLVLGGEAESLEGDWGGVRVVLHRWPNQEAARRFWQSPEYQELRRLREGTGTFRVMLLQGLEQEVLETRS